MTWTIFTAALFFALGFVLGLDFGRAPREPECEPWVCPLWLEPEPRYRSLIDEAYKERVN